jgi:hypothetical protein
MLDIGRPNDKADVMGFSDAELVAQLADQARLSARSYTCGLTGRLACRDDRRLKRDSRAAFSYSSNRGRHPPWSQARVPLETRGAGTVLRGEAHERHSSRDFYGK